MQYSDVLCHMVTGVQGACRRVSSAGDERALADINYLYEAMLYSALTMRWAGNRSAAPLTKSKLKLACGSSEESRVWRLCGLGHVRGGQTMSNSFMPSQGLMFGLMQSNITEPQTARTKSISEPQRTAKKRKVLTLITASIVHG